MTTSHTTQPRFLLPSRLPVLPRREKIRRVFDGLAGVFTMVIILGGIITAVMVVASIASAPLLNDQLYHGDMWFVAALAIGLVGFYAIHLTRGTLAIIMAGGRGERLKDLTEDRCKPATPFGGKFRIIDFVLSNCLNSGIRQISVLTQYKAHSLIQHIGKGWGFLRGEFGEFIETIPAQQRRGLGGLLGGRRRRRVPQVMG